MSTSRADEVELAAQVWEEDGEEDGLLLVLHWLFGAKGSGVWRT